jgi:hypothetical protein
MYRTRLQQAFNRLALLARDSGPLFVVAHITIPHHPFVYASNGDAVTPPRWFTFADDVLYYRKSAQTRADYAQRYVEQLRFVNTQVTAAVESILIHSARLPVILLQADHGPSIDWNDPRKVDARERMAILNACLLPGSDRAALFESMTPVNTLRMVANLYLGSQLPLLPDRSYYSSWSRPYAFREVTETTTGGSRTPGPR